MGDRASVKDVFVQCQTGLQGHGKLMKTLHKIYDKTGFEAFWSEFQHYLKYAMIVFKREPAVERMIDFVAKFAPTLCKKVSEKGGDQEGDDTLLDEDSVADNRLLQEMFDFLLTSHSARERGVRFRCCQLINKLLTNLGEDAQIDDDLYDRLYECMLERLKDKCPMVRYHAVLAMARLQDPADENCPVIKAYLFLLNCDPNADVRRAVMSSIAPSTKTLASIIGRTRDVKDTVRKTAYEVLAEKIHIKALSIASRLQLINEGLKDRSEMVRQACSSKLLQAWMRTVGGNIIDLLKSLDVEDSTDICSRVLETLFKAMSLKDMMASFNILDEKLLVPLDALNSESALYWQAVCKFIYAMGTDGDEYMEKVMPTVVDFCAYMQRYIDDLKKVEDPEIQLGREFIIEQLLLITSYMDTADVASKYVNDPFTLLKCQTIISEMLQQLKLSSVSSTLQMMIESQIVPGIQNEDAEVRNMAMQALGLCCYLSKDLLVTYIPLFMQASQIDVEGVRVTALQILFDLLLIYGLEIVDASEGSSNESLDNAQNVDGVDAVTSDTASSNSDNRNGTASKLVAIICSFLDGESSDLRTCAAEGLSKLLLSGRVVSSKILSHLILLWYNPLSEDDTHLRDCLGTFFPLYALASRCNQEVVEECFLPTLRTLLNAPATSPLAEVDVNNVAELLVQLTNTKLLTASQNSTETSMDNPGHDNLSETVCNEILSNPDSTHVKLWVRILNQMDVSPDNEVVLKDLRILAYKMCKTVKEKTSVRGLQKFQTRINELSSKFVTDNTDLENIEIEPVVPSTESAEEAPETATETPKRKRVRGLYSHNMTLAMESESELDIADDSTVEVDASCLMSRTSVETPSRRNRKNTSTTEIAEEDVFIAPNELQRPVSEAVADTGIEETDVVGDQRVPATESQNAVNPQEEKTTGKEKSPRSESPDKRGRPTEKKAASPKKIGRKSPVKSQEKRKASMSPADVSPEKRIASESPARRSQEKRKASKSPTRERKRMSKSPARSESYGRSSSNSPEKRKSSESPIKEAGRNRMAEFQEKSPERKNKSKSPARGNTEKRKSSASPTKTSGGKDDKASPAKKTKENAKASASNPKMSPVKKASKVQKPEKTKELVQHPVKGKSGLDEEQKRNEKLKKSQSPERKKSASKVPAKNSGKAVEKNIRKAMPKSIDTGRTRSAASISEVKSPRQARGVKPSDSGKLSSTNSPKPALKAGSKIVADTPDQVSRKVSTRSLVSSPDTSTPSGKGIPKGKSVAETPEHAVKQKPRQKETAPVSAGRSGARSISAKPVVVLTDVKARHQKTSTRTPRMTVNSASESSPEKTATITNRGKITSTDDSSTSSPDSAKQKTQKKGKGKVSPVKNLALETTTDEDEEEVSLKRKAKPSRRSATASASDSTVATPPVAGRTTRSSLSQSSLDSPSVRSLRQPTSVSGTKTLKNLQTAAGKRADEKTSLRPTRAGKSESSQSPRLSSRTGGTTTVSARSKSSDSGKTTKTKAAAPVANVTMSAVATKVTRDTKRPEPGKLKRPLRSKPSNRR
ncbi:condensin complex subunit 3-like [Mercenaria mercenaria]|uniref:condensin complex subunit 3-like n=1 Tax=Mercenaria mercenaria TaxID=6596 RepID=UPI00234F35D5|nr:condensin complex subunit 3-like [Mercenaria mercenaria]